MMVDSHYSCLILSAPVVIGVAANYEFSHWLTKRMNWSLSKESESCCILISRQSDLFS